MHEGVLEVNITGLQPDTSYSVQVAALTRKGDGDRSTPIDVKTPGGVPNRPDVNIKYVVSGVRSAFDVRRTFAATLLLLLSNVSLPLSRVSSKTPDIVLKLEWVRPSQTYGDLLGYRIRYGIKNQTLKEEFIQGTNQHVYKITDLGNFL